MTLVSACALKFSIQFCINWLPDLLSGVLYPGDMRAKGKSISRAITCISIAIELKLYPIVSSALTDYGTFYLYSFLIAISLPLIEGVGWFYLPETKDILLEQIQELYKPNSTIFYYSSDEENDYKNEGD